MAVGSRLKARLAHFSAAEGMLSLVARGLAWITRGKARLIRYHLVAQPVATTLLAGRSQGSTTSIRIVDPTDAIAADFPRPRRVIQRRFRDGATCFVATVRDKFAGFLWIAHDAYDEDEVRCRYELAQPRECVWDYDVYVHPEYRHGRTFARLWDAANAELARQGIRWSLSRISAFNAPSLAAHRRLGLRVLHSVTFFRFGRVQLAFCTRRPYFHLSLSPGSRPRLLLAVPEDRPPCVSKP